MPQWFMSEMSGRWVWMDATHCAFVVKSSLGWEWSVTDCTGKVLSRDHAPTADAAKAKAVRRMAINVENEQSRMTEGNH